MSNLTARLIECLATFLLLGGSAAALDRYMPGFHLGTYLIGWLLGHVVVVSAIKIERTAQ